MKTQLCSGYVSRGCRCHWCSRERGQWRAALLCAALACALGLVLALSGCGLSDYVEAPPEIPDAGAPGGEPDAASEIIFRCPPPCLGELTPTRLVCFCPEPPPRDAGSLCSCLEQGQCLASPLTVYPCPNADAMNETCGVCVPRDGGVR